MNVSPFAPSSASNLPPPNVATSSSSNAGTAASSIGRPVRVVHHVATTVAGTGVDTFVLQLCAAQQRLGIEPLIVCDFEKREEFVATAMRLRIPVHEMPPLGKLGTKLPQKAQTALLLAQRSRDTAKFLKDQRIDAVHVHAVALYGLEAHLATAFARVPIIVTHHATLEWWRPMWSRQSDAIMAIEKWRTTYVVCPYRKAADELRSHGYKSDRLVVVPFCADENAFNGSITQPEPGGPFHLITVSRLVKEKGHTELLEALAKIRGKLPQVRLSILGTGPAEADIKQTIERLKLGDIVHMAGYVPHAKVPELMRKAHVVMLPSYMGGETFPICLLEGMCMGMPSIGTRWFGIPDIIENGVNGLLVEPRDANGLAQAIETMAGDLGLFTRMGRAAAQRAEREFTGRAVANRYLELYRSAAALQPA